MHKNLKINFFMPHKLSDFFELPIGNEFLFRERKPSFLSSVICALIYCSLPVSLLEGSEV